MQYDGIIAALLGFAVLLPLFSFWVILCFGRWMGKAGELAAFVATGAIVGGFVLSLIAGVAWFSTMPAAQDGGHHAAADHNHDHHDQHNDNGESSGAAGDDYESHAPTRPPISRIWYTLATAGDLRLTIGCYIDSLTIIMFCMVTLIASCIHVYAMGYMHDELHDYTDHEVTLENGEHLHRPGRYHRFFQYLSLFCFSMLGLVVAGNVAMTFVFWELVGICSYFLIGFYVERQSASTAANKAFIVNRVGDFGFIIGLMAIWATLGTFNFGSMPKTDAVGKPLTDEQGHTVMQAGIFDMVRPEHYHGDDVPAHALILPEGMLRWGGSDLIDKKVRELASQGKSRDEIQREINHLVHQWQHAEIEKYHLRADIAHLQTTQGPEARKEIAAARAELHELNEEYSANRWAYYLMIVAGIGIFCGCVGKSAQFPLHTWLPDAMEGPTPVSALVHSATMVAAGVFLAARFFPFFLPEVLLVIAIAGVITLFMAATIALVATDIKRVLAYSTISQLGYMMMALGVGGWLAAVLHLITHAFFKSLLFLCSGSVIHAVHTNEMPEMGGLRKKMPVTAYTMLIGCLAIAGIGIPFFLGLSGFHSKDAVLEQAFHFGLTHGDWRLFFFAAATAGAGITAFYMFRMWFMTFTGKPRDQHRYDHAHESPRVMTVPLIILAFFAVVVAWPFFGLAVALDSARHPGTAEAITGAVSTAVFPNEHDLHTPENFSRIVAPVTFIALGTSLFGILFAAAFYLKGYISPAEVRQQFAGVYKFLWNKWWFDELYDFLFVRPSLVIARMISAFDRRWIDGLIDGTARCVVWFTQAWEYVVDRIGVDGTVNLIARWTYSFGASLRDIQTGRLRQYVMFIVIGTVALFLLASFVLSLTFAG